MTPQLTNLPNNPALNNLQKKRPSENIVQKREEIPVTSIFCFSDNVFCHVEKKKKKRNIRVIFDLS